MSHTNKIKAAMEQLRLAYEALNDCLPQEHKQTQYKPLASDYASDRILDLVRQYFGYDPLQPGRKKEVIYARHAHRYLLRKHTPRSTKSIAMLTSQGDDHSIVLNSCKVATNLIETDATFANIINQIEEKI